MYFQVDSLEECKQILSDIEHLETKAIWPNQQAPDWAISISTQLRTFTTNILVHFVAVRAITTFLLKEVER